MMLDELGLRRPSGYHIFFSADEETGSEDARPLVEAQARGKDFGLVFECGGPHGEVVSARKGVGTFRIEIEGKAAHAGNDYAQGINANLEAAHKLIAIQQLTDLKIGTTVNVGQMGGGIGANTISPSAFLLIDFRYAVDEEGQRIVAKHQEQAGTAYVAGTRSRLSGGIQRPVMVETQATRAFAELVNRASGGTVHTQKRGGVSDANFIAFAGVPTLDGFGPMGGKDHTVEEFMYTRSLFERIEHLGRALMKGEHQPLCTGGRLRRVRQPAFHRLHYQRTRWRWRGAPFRGGGLTVFLAALWEYGSKSPPFPAFSADIQPAF